MLIYLEQDISLTMIKHYYVEDVSGNGQVPPLVSTGSFNMFRQPPGHRDITKLLSARADVHGHLLFFIFTSGGQGAPDSTASGK